MNSPTHLEALPASVRIASHDIALVVRPGLRAEHEAWGQFIDVRDRIELEPDCGWWTFFNTVLHEITHAIFFCYSVSDQVGEEEIALVMGSAWAQIYRDNPALVQWITRMAAGPNQNEN